METFKQRLLVLCRSMLKRKMELLAFDMDEISESMQNETKSSAGDKHETARARMQSEHEKLSYMMAELHEQQNVLERIDPGRSTDRVSSENIVFTDRQIFFLAIPLGKMELDDKTVFVISKESPIAKKLIGLHVNETLVFNGVSYKILEIR